MTLPAILTHEPQFAEAIPFVKPQLPAFTSLADELQEILSTGQLTNNGRHVQQFEEELCRFLQVPFCVAVNNCTQGLSLLLRALGVSGSVLCPSFTFAATAQAICWAGARPKFVDIDPTHWCINPANIAEAATPDVTAVLAVHVFGVPAEVSALERACEAKSLPLIFDAAHAFGSRIGSDMAGRFGTAEVFSFHATKLLGVGEGGAVVTADRSLATELRNLRNFGIPEGVDQASNCIGTNAKMQEFNALIGRHLLGRITTTTAARQRTLETYRERLRPIGGLQLQHIPQTHEFNGQYAPVLIDEQAFGMGRDVLALALQAEGIQTRKYFHPPVHLQRSFIGSVEHLPVTEQVSGRVLCLPIHSGMSEELVHRVCDAVCDIQEHAAYVVKAVQS